uniref:V-SNARE coiled-coil homology domain-containing protein n=1 Tax=Meleagris gallopavo TaxID=9103 RepID=G1MYD0_MELGA
MAGIDGAFLCSQRNLLEEDSDEEEDFFLRGPSGPRFGPRNDKIRHVQNQVDEVIDVMQENITKVIERGERLDDLQDKSESLSDNATAFSNRAKQLRRQMWWRGCKVSKNWSDFLHAGPLAPGPNNRVSLCAGRTTREQFKLERIPVLCLL